MLELALHLDALAIQSLSAAADNVYISIETIEGKVFQQQANVFNRTDLLIIGHGAAVTSIVFMPPCAIVLEVMPWGYIIPGMFGSLAHDMNLIYRYLMTPTRPPSLLTDCPTAIEPDCRVGEHNLTIESFECRSCIRTNGVISVDLDNLNTILVDVALERAKCLIIEGERIF